MKFMKLGSKPDAFIADGNSIIRCVSSELATDVIIHVGAVKFCLHKFPLLSKSNRLQKLVQKANEESSDEIHLADFPGGPKAFEICAKFCYGVTVTLNAYNVVAARCAAEYLEMTEDVERGNLVFKIEVFLSSSVFHSWKDSIIVLQTTKSLLPWSEDLKIVGRCMDSIASKTSVDPSKINWSYTYNRKLLILEKNVANVVKFQEKVDSVPKDWWVEDICELDIDLYKRVMVAIKSKGRMDGNVMVEAVKTYAMRWLPDSVDARPFEAHNRRNRYLVETLIYMLPSDIGLRCSCSFLLKLLKFSILVGADDTLREDLMKRISLKLDEASINDLLIPARPPQTTKYDVELVQSLISQFVLREKRLWDLDISERTDKFTDDLILGHAALLNIGKLVDGYLEEIASDPNLALSTFILLSRSIPDSARPVHDGLYKAIDIYMKEHPNLSKAERKKICGLMDVKKLTMDASIHAAQNELLPLRVVVQVLFFEQARAAAGAQALHHPGDHSHSVTTTEEDWEKTVQEEGKSLQEQMSEMQITKTTKTGKLVKKGSTNRRRGIQLLPSKSRRIFNKLWMAGGKGRERSESRSSDTSGSSQSPTSMVPVETKSSRSSSRGRRHSIS